MHHQIRKQLRQHHRQIPNVDRNHPVIIPPNISNLRNQEAEDSLHQANISSQQRLISDFSEQIRDNIESFQLTGTSSVLRKQISGRQRATIYFSSKKYLQLASLHRCSTFTISKIKKNPLSAIGLNWRQFSSILSDMLDSNLMTWFTNSNGSSIFTLPPVNFSYRSGRNSQISTFHLAILKYVLCKKPDLYLDELLMILNFIDPELSISSSTLSRTLLKMGYSKRCPTRVIGQSDFLERQLYAEFILRYVTSPNQLVFLDEATNSRNSLRRYKSRAPAKTQPLGSNVIPSSRVNIIAAITILGIFEFNLITGTVDTSDIGYFLVNHVFPNMNPYPEPNSILIMDNARVHSLHDLGEYAWHHYGVLVLYLPPYSPDLNPIERLFGYCKAFFKRVIGSYPQLRRTPFVLWLLALAQASHRIDFHNLIISSYNFDDGTCQVQLF